MSCECEICKNNKEFEMPTDIIDAAQKENLVLFCGAGISTENKTVLPYTLYRDIADEMGLLNNDISFSHLMEEYCKQPNGRIKLLRKIRNRFEYIHSFPEVERRATRFHKELSELYFIHTIITTNWDTYFEDYCAATPITIPDDFTFFDENERLVLKIHGSINNLSTIIATESDYRRCSKNWKNGSIGGTLKNIFATKTVVFIGFSFGDEDLMQVLNYLKKEMGGVFPHIYIISPTENEGEKALIGNITHIMTDGTFFLHRIKEMKKANGTLVNIGAEKFVSELLQELYDIHEVLSDVDLQNSPMNIYCLSYQDGVIHAFERFIQLRQTGKYYKPGYINAVACSYDQLITKERKEKNYWNEAYYEGYFNGLIFIGSSCDDPSIADSFPRYYLPGTKHELSSYNVYFDELIKLKNSKSARYVYAEKHTRGYTDPSIKIHHPPFG